MTGQLDFLNFPYHRPIMYHEIPLSIGERNRPVADLMLLLRKAHPGEVTVIHLRVETSIRLPADLLVRLDRVDRNRSALLERAALLYLAHIERRLRDQQDREIIDHNAERLNRLAMDTLEYLRLS